MIMCPDKKSILIIDDKSENLALLTKILAKTSYQIRQAKDGELALSTAKTHPPDIILLDIRMPGMDGYEVCRLLKENNDLKHIPVIFITALDDSTHKIRAFAAGGADYIVKPFDPKEVLARVELHHNIQSHQNELEREVKLLRKDTHAETQNFKNTIALSDREKEALMWLARGFKNDRICEKMGIKDITVRLHISNARKKLDAVTREQALAIAIQIGAVTP